MRQKHSVGNKNKIAKFSGSSKNCIHIRGKIFPLNFNYLNLNLAESINCNWPGWQKLKLSLKFSNRLYPQIFFLRSSKPHFAIAGFQLHTEIFVENRKSAKIHSGKSFECACFLFASTICIFNFPLRLYRR